MVNDDRVWRWDEAGARESEGAQAQREMDELLMKASGASSPDGAEAVLLGRPRVEENREETVRLQVRVPRSWQRDIDRRASEGHMSRSQYLRRLIGRDSRQDA